MKTWEGNKENFQDKIYNYFAKKSYNVYFSTNKFD